MNTPFHPLIVHFPIALTFVLPVLVLVFAYMLKTNKMSSHGWLIIIGLQLATTITGYVSLESGEDDEHRVEKVLDKKLIHAHEEAAEVFVGSTVIALVISIAAFFLRKEIQFFAHLALVLISIVSCYLVYETGELGGDLIYRHGAAKAYGQSESLPSQNSLLPTPDMNTSESPMPEDENISLKPDENDYGNSDEDSEIEDEDFKQED